MGIVITVETVYVNSAVLPKQEYNHSLYFYLHDFIGWFSYLYNIRLVLSFGTEHENHNPLLRT